MNIAEEKELIIKKLQSVEDEALILAMLSLLDSEVNDVLNASIKRGIEQSVSGQARSHEEVMRQLKSRWRA